MKKAISFILLTTFCLPLAAADQAERLSQALNVLELEQGTSYSAPDLDFNAIDIAEAYEPTVEGYHAFETLASLIDEEYEPAYEPALTAFYRAFCHRNIDLGYHNLVQMRAMMAFYKLIRINYKPALAFARHAAFSQSSSDKHHIFTRGLLLFSKLVEAKYEPAFSDATHAAKEILGYCVIALYSFANSIVCNLAKAEYEPAIVFFFEHIYVPTHYTHPNERDFIEHLKTLYTPAIGAVTNSSQEDLWGTENTEDQGDTRQLRRVRRKKRRAGRLSKIQNAGYGHLF